MNKDTTTNILGEIHNSKRIKSADIHNLISKYAHRYIKLSTMTEAIMRHHQNSNTLFQAPKEKASNIQSKSNKIAPVA